MASVSAMANEPFIIAGPGGWRGRDRKPPDALVPSHTPCSFRPSAAARHMGAAGTAGRHASTWGGKAGVTAQVDHSRHHVTESLMRGAACHPLILGPVSLHTTVVERSDKRLPLPPSSSPTSGCPQSARANLVLALRHSERLSDG